MNPAVDPQPVRAGDIEPSTRLGGRLRAVLTPGRVDATAGFLGTGELDPGQVVSEHYHPFSDEFLYFIEGSVEITADGEPLSVAAGQALLLRRGTRHRFLAGAAGAHWVYVMTPLAPRPDLGHVDTEPAVNPAAAVPSLDQPAGVR